MNALNQLFEIIESVKFLIPKAMWEKYLSLKEEIQTEIDSMDDDIIYLERCIAALEAENCDLVAETDYLIAELNNLQQDYDDYTLEH